MAESAGTRSVLVTGGSGYVGSLLVAELAAKPGSLERIVSVDVRPPPSDRPSGRVEFAERDVRDPGLLDLLREHRVDTVVHLAAIVTPGRDSSRELEYSIDVGGTRNVVEASLAAGVRRLVLTSSGAAYGYHADNPQPLREEDPLRGNREFAYSDHKRQVEELLARERAQHPELSQLIFRPGTILGDRAANQITDLFDKPVILGVRGAPTPFVFIWDRDVVACLSRAVHAGGAGIYNLAGDGVMTLAEIARAVGKPYLELPAAWIGGALRVLRPLGLSQYGPEQVDFLRYRPVLSNEKLKREFGYVPRLSSREVFERFWRERRHA